MKVGDRVEGKHGTGTIVGIDGEGPNVLVEHDIWTGGHSGVVKSRNIKPYSGYYYYKEDLIFHVSERNKYVTVHFPKTGTSRVLFIYKTREAALLDALEMKNNGEQGLIAVLAIGVK